MQKATTNSMPSTISLAEVGRGSEVRTTLTLSYRVLQGCACIYSTRYSETHMRAIEHESNVRSRCTAKTWSQDVPCVAWCTFHVFCWHFILYSEHCSMCSSLASSQQLQLQDFVCVDIVVMTQLAPSLFEVVTHSAISDTFRTVKYAADLRPRLR